MHATAPPPRHASERWHLPRLGDATARPYLPSMPGGWTYIMTNRRDGVLYTGVTANLAQRVDQHRRGVGSTYCRRYNLTRLVHAEPHDRIEDAIRREKMLKAWKRVWKVELIEANNPAWDDLFDQIAG